MKKALLIYFTVLLSLCFPIASLHAEDNDEKASTARILTSSGSSLYSASAIAIGDDDHVSYFLTSAFFVNAGSEFYIIPDAVIDGQGNYMDDAAVKVTVFYTDATLNISILKAEKSVNSRYHPARFASVDQLEEGDDLRSLGFPVLESTQHGESALKDVTTVNGSVSANTCNETSMEKSCIQLSDEFKGSTDKEAAFIGGPVLASNGSVVGMRNVDGSSSEPELQHMTNADAIMKLLDEKNIPYLTASSSDSLPFPMLAAAVGLLIVLLVGFGAVKKKKGKSLHESPVQPSHVIPSDISGQVELVDTGSTQILADEHPSFIITGIHGMYEGQCFPVKDKIVFGRDASCCHIIFANIAGISREHCCIQLKEGTCILRDLHATYGTFHNQRKLADGGEVVLQIGDTFSLRDQENCFQLQKRGV